MVADAVIAGPGKIREGVISGPHNSGERGRFGSGSR
jgi:hypothetical protein